MTLLPLSQAASLFATSEAQLRPLVGGNFTNVFSFSKDECDCILRLIQTGKGVDVKSLDSIVAWMRFLASRGASVPELISSVNGNFVESVTHKENEYLVFAISRKPGTFSEEVPLDQWDDSLFHALGKTVGRIHALAKKYVPPAGLRCPDWDTIPNLFYRPQISQPWLEKKQASILARIRSLPRGSEDYGLVHADLHFGNFVVDVPNRAFSIFDFDDSVLGWYVMDVAILLFDVLVLYDGDDRTDFAMLFILNFMSGYLQENSLSAFWLTQIPNFLKLLEINIYDDVYARYTQGGGDAWVSKFMVARKERIEKDEPYANLDFEQLLIASPDMTVLRRESKSKPSKKEIVSQFAAIETIDSEALARKMGLYLWRELHILIAAKLYEMGRISSGRAARLAGMSRLEFLLNLGFYKIFPLQTELFDLEQHND